MEINQLLNNQLQTSQLKSDNAKSSVLQNAVNQALSEKDDQKLKDACQNLEAVFLDELMKAMRNTIPKSGLLKESYGEDVFQSMMDQEYSKIMAKTESTGLGQMIYDQLKFNLTLAKSNNNSTTE